MAKPDLRQAMQAKAGNGRTAAPAAVLDHLETQQAAKPAEHTASRYYRPSREGVTNVTGYYPPAVKKQLRMMSAEQDKTIQSLLAEALNDLFAKHGKPEIAPTESV